MYDGIALVKLRHWKTLRKIFLNLGFKKLELLERKCFFFGFSNDQELEQMDQLFITT